MTLTDCYTAIKLCEEHIKEIDMNLEVLTFKSTPTYVSLKKERDTYMGHLNNLNQDLERILNGIFLGARP